jgi:dipeptidyl aminopeptidase/acylaminoacyl peptidase
MTGSIRPWPVLLLVSLGNGGTAVAEEGRHWTVEDVVTVPAEFDLSLASDGKSLAYLERRADLEKNETVSILHLLDLRSRVSREILRAASAEQLRPLPNGKGWSFLLDRGDGLQLYVLDTEGTIKPLLARDAKVTVGQAEGGLFVVRSGAPRRIGILYHDWSPDGQWLWYAALKPRSEQVDVSIDDAVAGQRNRRRAPVKAIVELRLRSGMGEEWLVASRPSSDRLAFYYGSNVEWTDEGPRYQLEHSDAERAAGIGTFAWSFATKTSRPIEETSGFPAIGLLRGPNGGTLASEGFGSALALTETRTDGRKIQYGGQPYYVGDPRSAGNWLSADRRTALLGVRTLSHPRYGLVLLARRRAKPLIHSGSLTACDFRKDLAWGICVEEGLNQAPRLVQVAPHDGRVQTLAPLSPAHESIAPLRVTPHQWTNRLGYRATGFIVWPRDYQANSRYPAIIITHGSDADERFASADLQWNYPAQLFAERGYIVILMNDPSARQQAELWNAYMIWSGGPGTLGPAKLRELIWLNGVYSFEDAIAELASEGIVDPDRIGIAGYSRGSQMVNVAMTQSDILRAASSGDGNYLEPASYSDPKDGYHAVFGGPPSGNYLDAYRQLSPSLRADKACGPILQQMASPFAGAIDFYAALREAKVPAQISLYPGETTATDETHLFHIPSNRLRAMRENLAWFDFWLRDRRDPELDDRGAFDRWSKMAKQWKPGCTRALGAERR